MEHVVVERAFEQPYTINEINSIHRKFAWCLEQNRVRLIQSYLSLDRKRMICIYEAPDAESVRRINQQSGFPCNCIWTASVLR